MEIYSQLKSHLKFHTLPTSFASLTRSFMIAQKAPSFAILIFSLVPLNMLAHPNLLLKIRDSFYRGGVVQLMASKKSAHITLCALIYMDIHYGTEWYVHIKHLLMGRQTAAASIGKHCNFHSQSS